MIPKKEHINIYGYKGSRCPICKCFIALEDLNTQYSVTAFKEYEISGLCTRCQELVFGVED